MIITEKLGNELDSILPFLAEFETLLVVFCYFLDIPLKRIPGPYFDAHNKSDPFKYVVKFSFRQQMGYQSESHQMHPQKSRLDLLVT